MLKKGKRNALSGKKKKEAESNKVLPFRSRGPKKSNPDDGEILDHGKIGTLKYEVYKRGVIHIFSNSLTFKKDCDTFEDEIDDLNLEDMEVGGHAMIKGSGDNDHIVFQNGEDGIEIKLEKRGHDLVAQLKSLIHRGKSKKEAI